MVFPVTPTTLSDDFGSAQRRARRIRDVAQDANATMAAQSVSVEFLLVVLDDLRAANDLFNAVASRTGIAAFAQDQVGRAVGSDFAAMIAEIDSAITYIISALPKDGQNHLLATTIDAQGGRTSVFFTPSQTAPLRSRLDDVIAAIGE